MSIVNRQELLDLHMCAVRCGQKRHAASQYGRSKQTVHVCHPNRKTSKPNACIAGQLLQAPFAHTHESLKLAGFYGMVQLQKPLMTAAINATLMQPDYSHACLHLALEPEPEHLTRLHYWAAAQGQQQQWFQ